LESVRVLIVLGVTVALLGLFGRTEAQEPQASGVVVHQVHGIVIDQETGAGVAGATVSVLLQGRRAADTVTDSAGRYLLEARLRTGRTGEVVRALAVGFVPEAQEVELVCPEIVTRGRERPYCRKEVNLYLQPAQRMFEPSAATCTLEGTVRDGGGAPLQGVTVRLEDGGRGAMTDEDGRFAIEQVRSGLRVARAERIGRITHERLILVGCSKPGGLVITRFQSLPSLGIW
jgi:hypothetical protein